MGGNSLNYLSFIVVGGVPTLRFLSGTLNIYPWGGIYANKFLKNQNYFR